MTGIDAAAAVAASLSDPVIILDRKARIVSANDAAAAMLDSSAAQLKGECLAGFLDESAEAFREKVRLWARSRQPVPGAIHVRDDGRTRRLSCEAAALVIPGSENSGLVIVHCREHAESLKRFDALNGKIQELAREIRERQRTEAALRESEQRFRRLFEHASDAILIADDQGVLEDANPAACDLIGRTRQDVLGLRVLDLAPPEERDATAARWQGFADAGAQMGTFVIARPGGERREVEYSAARDFVSGQHLSILRDVTERNRAERERALQAEALARSNAELEQYAYVASHDLQEPLRTISSFLKLIEKRLAAVLDEETTEYMQFVQEAAARQRRVILDLLELSRLGRVQRSDKGVDLNRTLQQVLKYLQAAIAESGAEVVSPDPLPIVRGDPTQLYQLFFNLVHNAMKFHSGQPRVEVRGERNGAEWIIRVSDNGVGIESQYYATIFEPFRRLHGREVPGSGIGLALCKRVVENHKGRIWVESSPGQGSTFYVALPVVAEAASSANATRD